ncbi:PREDICTED: pickpocket protein 19 [Drosophila arizonae]|uniref:Pickpocket protein 19 n=1 Tax=Drosophila arizonae TaxID=7263 RepID=A0ABM1P833_DROAR|nr:PREDICTED: pickpocket protein 19 [Drosophila arizonae]
MFYPQELPHPKARRPLYGNYIDKTVPRHQKATGCCKDGKFVGLMLPYLKEYCATSSVHGFRYLTDPKLRTFERFIWLLILLGTFICATIVYVDLTELYNSARVHTTIEDSMQPIFFVPFPSVGLCPRSRINWPRLLKETPEEFLGSDASAEKRELFKSFFAAASGVHLRDMHSLGSFFENSSLAGQIRQLDGLDVVKVLEALNLNCNDFFKSCTWRGKQHNCCEIFELQRTEYGFCWVFNSAVSAEMQQRQREDKYYPRRTAQSGPGTGLEVYLQLNKSLTMPGLRGIYVMVKQPQQWSESARLVPHDCHNRISMVPRYTGSDSRTRTLTAKVRRCIFPDEIHDPHYKNLPGLVYWRGNCRSKCHQEHVVNLCNCSPTLLFPRHQKDNFSECKASDFKCLYEHRLTFSVERLPLEQEYVDNVYKDSMTCDCLNSCSQLIYDTIYSSSAMEPQELTADTISMHLDIFFQSSWYIKYQTHMRFTFVELLASFGGIIGLFLGASLLSAIELIYYATIGLYLYLHHYNLKTKQQPRAPESPAPITLKFRHKITPTKIVY